jgi:ATP-dependent helicase Lhr and Lhr-like helicase
LTQQIISVIVERGGARAEEIYDLLCRKGPFRSIEATLFGKLLRTLGLRDILEQRPAGELILGLEGEQIARSIDFYGVFSASKEAKVLHRGRVLGTLPVLVLPKENTSIVFAGRKWKVLSVDRGKREIEVEPSASRGRPSFVGYGTPVHPRLRQKIREVLRSWTPFGYLDASAARLLSKARKVAQEAMLCTQSFVALEPDSTLIMTWTGTCTQKTLVAMLGLAEFKCSDADIGIRFAGPIREAREAVARIQARSFDPEKLAECVERDADRKFEYLLDENLVRISISREVVDLAGAKKVCEQLLSA